MWENAWFIARKDVQYELRERSTLAWLFVMPIVFFYFIGTVTGGGLGISTQSSDLAVQTTEQNGFLVDQLLKRLEDNRFEITSFSVSEPNVLENFERWLIIPSAFTESVSNGDAVKLEFVSKEAGLSHDLDSLKATRAVYTVLADLIAVKESKNSPSVEAFEQLNAIPRTLTLEVKPGGKRQEIPSGFEQAIPGTMVMFTMLILLTSGAISLVIERERGNLRRLASTPITRGQIVFGKWGGKMALGVIQIGFAMVVGTAVFNMQWGPDLPMVFLVMLGWGTFCASLAVLLANLGHNHSQVAGIGALTSMLLAALGGAWWPIEVTPPFMQSLQKFLPSGWTMDALHKLISFEAGALSTIPHVIALIVAALIVGWIGAKRFRFSS